MREKGVFGGVVLCLRGGFVSNVMSSTRLNLGEIFENMGNEWDFGLLEGAPLMPFDRLRMSGSGGSRTAPTGSGVVVRLLWVCMGIGYGVDGGVGKGEMSGGAPRHQIATLVARNDGEGGEGEEGSGRIYQE